jgi:hypothetical protein
MHIRIKCDRICGLVPELMATEQRYIVSCEVRTEIIYDM